MRAAILKRLSRASGSLIALVKEPLERTTGERRGPPSDEEAVEPGTLEASLVGTMTPDPAGNKLIIKVPESWEPNQWSEKQASGPNQLTNERVFDEENTIRVPAGKAALIWLEVAPPKEHLDWPTTVTRARFEVSVTDRFLTAPSIRGKGKVVMLYDDNTDNPVDYSWELSLEIGGAWYDPQIKNIGNEPPPID